MEENRIENEVVEYFDSCPVQEKVFYHVQGRPLPRCILPSAAPVAEAYAPPVKKRKMKTVWIVVIAVSALIAIAAGALGLGYAVGSHMDVYYEGGFSTKTDKSEAAYTTIPLVDAWGGAEVEPVSHCGEILTPQEIYAKVNPAVVSVVTAVEENYRGYGTGMIFTPDGFVLTNAHVIEGGRMCAVYLSTGEAYEAKLVGYDEEQDLAVLKIEAQDLPFVEFGDSDLVVVGDTVYAIGNPLGYELRGTMTDGIVSAINRDVSVSGGGTMTLMQTNAALNNGNSGGPLINQYGQVVGVNVIKMKSNYTNGTVEGLGFAIPISANAHKINEIIETGKTSPDPVIGISVELFASEAEEGVQGLLVMEVMEDSGAEKAGVKVGDYVLTVNGKAVNTSDDVLFQRRGLHAGDAMEMTLWRDGEIFDVTIVLQEAES
ncbi:MAG: trypsin-like peptidase domain-containing protein [Oscillospiraceae bacterium]|nr:trypsin-like peptidase domain-containing protein [Oscillospiraceae bacterium]